MKKLIGIAALSALVAAASNVSAEPAGWILNRTVVQVVNTGNGGFNIRLTPDLTGCTAQSGYSSAYASVYPSHPGLSRIKADMVVALVTGRPVSLYFSDAACTVGETVLGPY